MRPRVLVAKVVHVARGDERQARGLRELRQVGVDPLLDLEPGVLDLEIGRIRPEDVTKIRDLLLGLGGVPVLERLADPAGEAAREREESLGVALQELPVDPRLVVVALEVAGRGELDQVRVALVRLGQKGQVRIALLLRPAVVGDVDLAADDRLHACLPGLLVELDRAGERPMVGEGDGRHLELRGPRREVRDAARAVEDRVLGVDVEMDERRLRHGQPILAPGSDDSDSFPTTATAGG